MIGVWFLVLFSISCLILCEGAITSPPDGEKFLFLPGETEKIKWEIDDPVSALVLRSWSYKSSKGATLKSLARIFANGSIDPQTNLFDFAIERPATLVLKNINQSYNGVYQFSYTASGTFVSEVVVSIANAPTVNLSCPGRNEVNEGNNFTCVCRGVEGNPPANVTWYKGVVQISETKKENNTLNLYDVNATDSGTYTCIAQSYPTEAFKDEKSMELAVRLNEKPNNTNITFIPQPVMIDGSVEIKCDSVGVPGPDFIINGPNGKLDVTGQSHTIENVKKSDEGSYTCIATNALGNDSATDYLNVTGSTQTTQEPTTIKPSPTQNIVSSTAKRKVPTPPPPPGPGPPVGLIVGIGIGVLVLLLIVCVVVYRYKKREKEGGNRGNVDPAAGNHYELENEDAGPGDNAYDSVGPVGTSSGKSKPPEKKNTLPPVYAAVDKNNRQGNTLYASLDTDAMKPKRESKKEPERTPQTEYASIDFAKRADDNVPKADLV